jgi:putative NADH-flavin reductase
MKALILGATGFIGAPILAEALRRPEIQVTAFVRDPDKLAPQERLTTIIGTIEDRDALTAACAEHDAVIHAWHPGRGAGADSVYAQSVAGHEAIVAAAKAAGLPRLLCVGGAASLMTPEGKEYIDSSLWDPEFDPYRQSILGTRALYHLLKPETGIDWVFFAPSAWLRPGERTGKFRYGKNEMLFAPDGTSCLSLEDYALAMVDELVAPRHHRERFTAGY